MEDHQEEMSGNSLWVKGDDTSEFIIKTDVPHPAISGEGLAGREESGPFAALGEALDAAFSRPENQGWFILSLGVALFLYLVMWFINDAWYFLVNSWYRVHGEITSATAVTSTPIPALTPTIAPTPFPGSSPAPVNASSPPVLFCTAMLCGGVLVIALMVVFKKRKTPAPNR